MAGKKKPMVIEISSSSEEEEETKRNKSEDEKGRRRRKYSVLEVKTEDKRREEEEEDCYILPFDPLADDLNQKLSLNDAQSQLDDLSIVAERGQCYCYVCDEAAPCKFWKEPNGHCHASDQDKKWKEMRKLVAKRKGQKKGTFFF
ncbi:uncharacterized protein [Elaeis guineensis]|uniref:Uncharacterized protein LOC105053863 isoform X2 n=1 Tax=Elaeis guineensis var. tenera TaxID=51953 RepID=A0A6I9RXG8_ELAGV|nr:uncharacterized protein LOC105053863 isoform X2 [Elaeis guineensis]